MNFQWQSIHRFDHEKGFGVQWNCTLRDVNGNPTGKSARVIYGFRTGGWTWELWSGGYKPERKTLVAVETADEAKAALEKMWREKANEYAEII